MANAKIKHLQLPNGTTYDFHAVTTDSATSATTSTYLSVPRVAKDSQSLPGANKCIVEEYSSGTNYNLPSNAFYHIYSSQGSDTKYGCQLALGMTTEAAYYRIYNNQSWKGWKSIINTWRPVQNNLTSDSTTDSLSAAQGKALANGSARDNTKVAKSGDTMTGTLKLGSSSQSSFPTVGIDIHDVRSVNFLPSAMDKGANFFFSNNTMPNTNWWAGLHVKGWTGAYAAWEIVGSAHNNDARTTPLYVRSSNTNSAWGSWRKIYDTSNPPTASEVGALANTVKYAGASTAGGSATSAAKLDTATAGSATQPCYFANGVPTACTYSLNKTVPSDAVFTDTDTHRPIQINAAQFLGSNNIPFNINAGDNITLVADEGTATVTIKGTANNAVTQTATTTNANYEVLFSATADNTTRTEGARKNSNLTFNPSTGALTCTGNIYTNSEGVFGTGIELGMYANDSLSFIDFHWNSKNTDWTARIVQRGENTVDLIGKNSSTWGIWRAASFSSQSSIHVKENVQSITAEDARRLLQLRPVTFNYKNGGLTDQAGLIAEEVNLVMPKMVIGDINFNPEEPWNAPSIDYSKFTPYLIKMVQEQQKEIDELRRLVQG